MTDTAIAHHQLAQALILATDLEAGITTEATLDLATGLANETLTDLAAPGFLDSGGLVVSYTESGLNLLEGIDSRDLVGARLLAEGNVVADHDRLATFLATMRGELLADIERARSVNGFVASITGVVVVLLVPVTMVAIYRLLARRQLRRAELEAKLAAEQELSRSKDEFIANISHELRTPLKASMGSLACWNKGQ